MGARRRTLIRLAVGLGLLAALGIALSIRLNQSTHAHAHAGRGSEGGPAGADPRIASSTSPTPPGSTNPFEIQVAAMVARLDSGTTELARLAGATGGTPAQAVTAFGLRAELRAPNATVSAEAIVRFLASGHDASTGLPFAPDPSGFLEAAPTVRSLVLDELERLDQARARAAATVILNGAAQAADEWAVALRILGHAGIMDTPSGRDYFTGRVETLLENPPWLAEPAAGFLHAFDAAVFIGQATFLDSLSRLSAPDLPVAVQFAARLAAERIVTADYATAAGRLVEQPSLFAHHPTFRGMVIARADTRAPSQRAVLERFLANPLTPSAEVAAWADYFPNNNLHLSNNLLTRGKPVPAAELALIDRDAVVAVRTWRADPGFARIESQLARVQDRLERMLASGGH